jgi:hypothetical protein
MYSGSISTGAYNTVSYKYYRLYYVCIASGIPGA